MCSNNQFIGVLLFFFPLLAAQQEDKVNYKGLEQSTLRTWLEEGCCSSQVMVAVLKQHGTMSSSPKFDNEISRTNIFRWFPGSIPM